MTDIILKSYETYHKRKRPQIMKDVILSVIKSSEERLKNPFIGTFILSFIAFNWKPITILFLSDQVIENRVKYMSNNFSEFEDLFMYPLIISLIYITIIPYLMWFFESITFKSYKERNRNIYRNKVVDIEGRKSVAISEIELEDLKADHKEKADLNNHINSLKIKLLDAEQLLKSTEQRGDKLIQENSELKNELVKKESTIDSLYLKIDDSDLQVKDYYDEYKNTPKNTIRDFVNNFFKINNFDSNKEGQYLLDRFISQGLLKVSTEDHNGKKSEFYLITEKGLFFIKRANSEKII